MLYHSTVQCTLQRPTITTDFFQYISDISVTFLSFSNCLHQCDVDSAHVKLCLSCCRLHSVRHAGESGRAPPRSVTSRGYIMLKWFPVAALQLKVAVGALMSAATENKDCGKFGALLALRSVHRTHSHGAQCLLSGQCTGHIAVGCTACSQVSAPDT